MKKIFEAFLILVIFYGVYSAFSQVAPMLFENPNIFWVIVASLITAALLLFLYAGVISSATKQKLKQTIQHLEQDVQEKDLKLKNAFRFKKEIEEAAEETITINN